MQPTTIGWVAAAALLVGALVRLLKSNMLAIALANLGVPPIPKRVLPWLALALGLASSILDHRLQGTEWIEAVTKGIVAALTAIAGHEVGVESLRKGKEVLLVLACVAFGSSACALFNDPKTATSSVLSVADLFCLETGDGASITDAKAAAVACKMVDASKDLAPDLVDAITKLIGQREAGKKAGYHWMPAGIVETVSDAGLKDATGQ